MLWLLTLIILWPKDSTVLASNSLPRNGALTMMLETDVDSNEYSVATSNEWPEEGYIFNAEMSACERGSELIWNDETKTVNIKASTSDTCYIYFDKEMESALLDFCLERTLSECISNYIYTGDGNEDIYYHDGVGSYTNATEEAGDYSYRYVGADPANYVCFGSDEETCPADNLYRIIGVFGDNVKLIKNTSLGSYYWSSTNTSEWIESTLNDIYLNELGTNWINTITDANWYISGTSYVNYGTTKDVYDYELIRYSSIYQGKIGLIYISDYTYATIPENWSLNISSYSEALNIENNWMYLGEDEWTLTEYCCEIVKYAMINIIDDTGVVNESFYDNNYAVRPTFYLNANVTYESGTGSSTDPFRISL